MNRKRVLSGLVVVVMGAGVLSVCGGEDDGGSSSEAQPLVYLEETIPPCTRLPGPGLDPCVRGPVPRLPSAASVYYDEIPAYWDLYFDADEPPFTYSPHLVIRATFLPDTTRCAMYKRVTPAFSVYTAGSNEYLLQCFIDVRVNDYLIGVGPPTMSVVAYVYPFYYPDDDTSHLVEKYGLDGDVYEGREGVLFLAPAPTTVVEAWRMTEFWAVRRDGEAVLVVAPYKNIIESTYQDKFTAEELALLEKPLSDFEIIIKEAAAARAEATGGRIGVGDDLPMLITDANLLRPYYEGPGVGVDYDSDPPQPPPPVPEIEGPG